jgi:hypothetical protein
MNMRSYGAAEKDDERMALKILTAAEDLLDGKDNLEIHTTQNGREPICLNLLRKLSC